MLQCCCVLVIESEGNIKLGFVLYSNLGLFYRGVYLSIFIPVQDET